MTAIKTYLLRLVFCGFLISLCSALLRGRRGERAAILCGGCLLILTAVRPLLRVDLSKLPDLITGLTASQRQEEARAKNDALLKALVEEQTVSWLEEKARELGMDVAFSVSAIELESGTFVPEEITVRGVWTEEQRQAMTERITADLEIPPEKLRWVGE